MGMEDVYGQHGPIARSRRVCVDLHVPVHDLVVNSRMGQYPVRVPSCVSRVAWCFPSCVVLRARALVRVRVACCVALSCVSVLRAVLRALPWCFVRVPCCVLSCVSRVSRVACSACRVALRRVAPVLLSRHAGPYRSPETSTCRHAAAGEQRMAAEPIEPTAKHYIGGSGIPFPFFQPSGSLSATCGRAPRRRKAACDVVDHQHPVLVLAL